MNTLYDILEVSQKASKEVIEKAYRVLAKKYHPDLQTPENRAMAEKKMKEINEAYDVLSNEDKRKEYDQKLILEKQLKEQETIQQNKKNPETYAQSVGCGYQSQPHQQNMYDNNYNASINTGTQEEQRYRDMQRRKYEEQLKKQQEQMSKKMEQNMQQQYENAYYNYLRSLGYKIKERWTWKRTIQLIITLLIMIGIVVLLWFLPPTHDMMVNFYESNKIVKIIVDIILGIVNAIAQTIGELFKDLFS